MKIRLLAVLVFSSLLVLSAAAAVLAQDGRRDRDVNIQYVDCSQVQNAIGNQYGNATAIGRDAAAEIAQDLNISQDQVNACLGEIGVNDNNDDDDDRNNNDNDDGNTGKDDDDDEGSAKADVIDDTIPKVASLPNTGGPSLPAVGLGVALVAAGASLIGFSVRR